VRTEALDESLIYRSGPPFQRWAYEHAARHFHAQGIRRYGASKNGNPYAHLLHADDSTLNFLSPVVGEAVAARFDHHKAGDRARTETNTVASQPCCFNLFVPLARDLPLASNVFSDLMARPVTIDHIEIEFTPNQLRALPGYELGERGESLGDQSGSGGTDADVAVFYRSSAGRGVILIEFKYIESEFSTCGSYATKDEKRRALLRPLCKSASFVPLVTEPRRDDQGRPLCGYTKYRNWELTRGSTAFDWEKIAALPRCPFSGSGQQLWRNVLLAENVARERHLEQFAFWVIAPRDNDALWRGDGGDIFEEFGALLTASARQTFRRLQTESVLERVEARLSRSDERNRWWISAFRDRYLPPSPIRGGADDSVEGLR
jgi:hypothetical protein